MRRGCRRNLLARACAAKAFITGTGQTQGRAGSERMIFSGLGEYLSARRTGRSDIDKKANAAGWSIESKIPLAMPGRRQRTVRSTPRETPGLSTRRLPSPGSARNSASITIFPATAVELARMRRRQSRKSVHGCGQARVATRGAARCGILTPADATDRAARIRPCLRPSGSRCPS